MMPRDQQSRSGSTNQIDLGNPASIEKSALLSSLQLGGYATLLSNNPTNLPSVDNRDQKNVNKGQTLNDLEQNVWHSQEIKIDRIPTQIDQPEKAKNSNPGLSNEIEILISPI